MELKRIFIALIALPCCLSAMAVEAKINGLWYELVSRAKEAKVIEYKNNVKYSGDVVIPEKVEYEGVEYSVTSIGDYAFSGCVSLTSVIIPNSVKNIGEDAFFICSHLKSAIIGNGVTCINKSTFEGCSDLISVTIPNSVTSIGVSAFYGCSGLTSVTIPNSVTSIGGGAFQNCTSLTSVTIPTSVESIGGGAFQNCTSLTSVPIPNSVTSIEKGAFSGCRGLTSVTIGSGIKNIYSNAFAKCSELADVYCLAENVPQTVTDAFEDSYINLSTLHVPTSVIDNYRATSPWSEFGTIVTLDGDEPVVPEPEQCAKPTIHYQNGKLTFKCETEGVEFMSEITDADIRKNYTAEIDLAVTYHISVYATKSGLENSETATATLCWIEMEPQTEGITGDEDTVSEVRAVPVLIQSNGNTLTIDGATAGTPIHVYDLGGRLVANTTATDIITMVNVPTKEQVIIVKVGDKAVKVRR